MEWEMITDIQFNKWNDRKLNNYNGIKTHIPEIPVKLFLELN